MSADKGGPVTLPDEQRAELAALEAVAAGQAGLVAAVTEPEPAAPAVDLAGELRAMIALFVGMVGLVFPSLPKIYTPEATTAASEAVASVCVKHGWLSGGLMGDWGEEIAAAVVLAPLALATYQGIRADISAAKKPGVPDTGGAAAKVGADGEVNQKTVVFGAPILVKPEATA